MVNTGRLNAVTGAYGFSGKYITRRLLERGERVRSLTNHPDPHSSHAAMVETAPLRFDSVSELAGNLSGVEVLYNTYWVRFAHGAITHEQAVENTRVLIQAAELAGVRRMIHVSITNPSRESVLPYFRGKALVEEAIMSSRLSYAILRPAVIFGDEDILINNIAWMLRCFPLFAIPGKGEYRLQPIYVEDLADLAVSAAGETGNMITNATGPESFSYEELVREVREVLGSHSRLIHLPASLVLFASRMIGALVGDVVLTRDEISGLMAGLLAVHEPATGSTSLRRWLRQHRSSLGGQYASELARHYR